MFDILMKHIEKSPVDSWNRTDGLQPLLDRWSRMEDWKRKAYEELLEENPAFTIESI